MAIPMNSNLSFAFISEEMALLFLINCRLRRYILTPSDLTIKFLFSLLQLCCLAAVYVLWTSTKAREIQNSKIAQPFFISIFSHISAIIFIKIKSYMAKARNLCEIRLDSIWPHLQIRNYPTGSELERDAA